MDFAQLAENFLDTYGLAAVFAIMLLKEIGVPVPIPSDLIMLGAAARAAQGKFSLVAVFLAILIPMVVGGVIQFAIAKGPARAIIYRVGRYIGLTEARLDRAMETIRRGGVAAVILGLTTPGVRIATVPASGLAQLAWRTFAPGLIAGSSFFLAWHFAIGYLGGLALLLLNLGLPVLIVIGLGVIALGVGGWLFVRARSKQKMSLPEIYNEWADASCPACVTIALIRGRQSV